MSNDTSVWRKVADWDEALPKDPLTPGAHSGIVSRLLRVEITVFDSTLATSLGSVRHSQL